MLKGLDIKLPTPVVDRAESITALYPSLLQRVLLEGQHVAPRGRPTLEISPLLFVIKDPHQSLVLQRARKLNRAFAIVEKLALVGGLDDPEPLCFYVDRLREYINPCTGRLDGAYGPRVARQLPYIYDLLRRDPESRRAVISLFSEADQHESFDVPCTVSLQFLLRSQKLSMIATMRSSDLFLGLPYDVNQFCFVQQVVASWLGVDLGTYTHFAGSAHLYESDIARAREVLASPDDLVGGKEPLLKMSYDETVSEVQRFFQFERRLRSDPATGEDAIEQARLHPTLGAWARELADFIAKKQHVSDGVGEAARLCNRS